MKTLRLALFILISGFIAKAGAQTKAPPAATKAPAAPSKTSAAPAPVPEVEWFPPETENSTTPDRAKVIISGKTQRRSVIQVDGADVTIINSRQPSPKITGRATRANAEGFFELALELPEGLAQIPISIITPANAQKTFLVSVDVKVSAEEEKNIVKMSNKVSPNRPPAAAKNVRLWIGAGFTYQSYNQLTTGSPDLAFTTVQVPGLVARGGYWGERWGLDLYLRDAPGKIAAATPLQIQTDTYHWRTTEAKGLYQFARGPNSRLWGRPTQWQLRFGTQVHQIPFLEISNTNLVTINDMTLTTGTLGIGLLLGQEQDWAYEFAIGIQQPISSSGKSGVTYTLSSPQAFEAQFGAAYKFAPNWRLGFFSYTQSLDYAYQYRNETGTTKNGKQKLFYTTFDLRLGFEF